MKRLLLVAGILLTATLPLLGDEWVERPQRLTEGVGDGVATGLDGTLYMAPRITEEDELFRNAAALDVWSMTRSSDGTLWIGTGPRGEVLIRDAQSRERRIDTGDSMVTALLARGDGSVLAATSPQGNIWQLRADGSKTLWCESGARFVWALAESAGGNVYAATGPEGRLLKLRPGAGSDVVFDASEPHLVSLLPTADGGWIAGGGGAGRVYRIDNEGNGWVAYDDSFEEAVSIVADRDGGWFVLLLNRPREARPAQGVRIQLSAPPTAGGNFDGAAAGTTMWGELQPTDEEQTRQGNNAPGRIIHLTDDGAVTTVWERPLAVPLTASLDADGRLLVGTRSPAGLYRRELDGRWARLHAFEGSHVAAISPDGDARWIALSAPPGLRRLEALPSSEGSFTSAPFDAGAIARWGMLSWYVRGRMPRVELYGRTGNSERPDETWSGWSPALVLADGTPTSLPEGRFAQWKLRMVGSQEPQAHLSHVAWSYATVNRPPLIEAASFDRFVVRDRLQSTLRANDPDRDALHVVLEYRSRSETTWQIVGPSQTSTSSTNEWTLETLSEGLYEMRLRVDDGQQTQHSNVSLIRVDRTAPQIAATAKSGGQIDVEVSDPGGRVERLEWFVDGAWGGRAVPRDGVCDEDRERFVLTVAPGATIELEATDAAGNTVRQPLPEGGS